VPLHLTGSSDSLSRSRTTMRSTYGDRAVATDEPARLGPITTMLLTAGAADECDMQRLFLPIPRYYARNFRWVAS
jgi:hypothetical protein